MPRSIDIGAFLELSEEGVIIDVRSEQEFDHAHFPGAINIPLLNNEHRKIIGTTYKQQGRNAAIAKGFELIGPLFGTFYEKTGDAVGKKNPYFYCWRGGMRSQISASVFEWGGNRSTVLSGGYKAYRNAVLKGLKRKLKLVVISGFTGAGKTEILEILKQNGEQVIDLENLANHRGSALGALGKAAQPANEMFENLLFEQFRRMDSDGYVFIENESRKIGSNIIPEGLWQQMDKASLMDIRVPKAIRLERILKEYGIFPAEQLSECTSRLKKRLGGLNLKNALGALDSGDLRTWSEILMDYYDRTYQFGREGKPPADGEMDWDWNAIEASVAKFKQTLEGINTGD